MHPSYNRIRYFDPKFSAKNLKDPFAVPEDKAKK